MSRWPAGVVKPDHLYVVAVDDRPGYVKIGRSESPRNRLAALKSRNGPAVLTLAEVFPYAGRLEYDVHKEFDDIRVTGEWFDFGVGEYLPTIRAAVGRLAAACDDGVEPAPLTAFTEEERQLAMPPEPPYGCPECKTSAWAVIGPYGAAVSFFFENCADPWAYLNAKGYGDCCIKATFGKEIPERSEAPD